MLSGKLAASILGSSLTGGGVIKKVKEQLEQVKIFNATPFFD